MAESVVYCNDVMNLDKFLNYGQLVVCCIQNEAAIWHFVHYSNVIQLIAFIHLNTIQIHNLNPHWTQINYYLSYTKRKLQEI